MLYGRINSTPLATIATVYATAVIGNSNRNQVIEEEVKALSSILQFKNHLCRNIKYICYNITEWLEQNLCWKVWAFNLSRNWCGHCESLGKCQELHPPSSWKRLLDFGWSDNHFANKNSSEEIDFPSLSSFPRGSAVSIPLYLDHIFVSEINKANNI